MLIEYLFKLTNFLSDPNWKPAKFLNDWLSKTDETDKNSIF